MSDNANNVDNVDVNFNDNNYQRFEFIRQQWKFLQTLMNRSHDDDDDDVNDSSNNDNNVNSDNNSLRIEDVDYFDSDYEINESNVLVANAERHVFYIDVYIFVDRLKKLIARRDNDKVQKIITFCLKDTTLIWHFSELIDMKRTLFRIVTCDQ